MTAEAGRLLAELASAAERQPPPGGTGPYDYVRTLGWYLHSSHLVAGDRLEFVDSRIDRTERELWLAPDGSGRIEELRAGRRTDTSQRYGDGELHRPTELMVAGPGAVRLLEALGELWSNRVVEPAVHAAALRRLAGAAGLAVVSPVVDRVGRAGAGIAAVSDRARHVAVFDPVTGMLLAIEEIELVPAEHLPGPPPLTTSYTAYLGSARVPDTDTRPDREPDVRS